MTQLGSYLSPEPLLQSPEYVRRMAQSGLSVPTYAYALNNPLRYVDPDGLYVRWDVRDADLTAAILDIASNPRLAKNFHRLFADPKNGVFIERGPEGGLKLKGGGFTSPPYRNSRGGDSCSITVDPVGQYERVRGYGPTALVQDNLSALVAHEMGHGFANIYGGDTNTTAIDWENALRTGPARAYSPPGLWEHAWPR